MFDSSLIWFNKLCSFCLLKGVRTEAHSSSLCKQVNNLKAICEIQKRTKTRYQVLIMITLTHHHFEETLLFKTAIPNAHLSTLAV